MKIRSLTSASIKQRAC